MTVYEFVCVKDIEFEGKTVKEITILRPTFKKSCLKNDMLPDDEFIHNFQEVIKRLIVLLIFYL